MGKIKINFIYEGMIKNVNADVGDTILEVARLNNIPLRGNCDGNGSCGSCHIILDDVDPRNFEIGEREEDILEKVPGRTPASRLGCQMILTEEMENITIKIPK